jgi:hypothetical protein
MNAAPSSALAPPLRFSDHWQQLLITSVALQYQKERIGHGECSVTGEVPTQVWESEDESERLIGLPIPDIQRGVLDTYAKLRQLEVPGVHFNGVRIEGEPSVTPPPINTDVRHDLPDCKDQVFDITGYWLTLDHHGAALRFSAGVSWTLKAAVQAA